MVLAVLRSAAAPVPPAFSSKTKSWRGAAVATILREDVIAVRTFVAIWHELSQRSATTMPRMIVIILNEVVSAGMEMLLRCRQRNTTRLSDSLVCDEQIYDGRADATIPASDSISLGQEQRTN
jgi:hypothetical protein